MTLAKSLQAAAGNAGEATYIEDLFSTYLYTGNGSTQTITNGIDLAGEGGLVWVKNRSSAVSNWLVDTARGVGADISSNTTTASGSVDATKMSFDSTGFSFLKYVGTAVNASSTNYASWTFRKAEKFFDVVTYTGNDVAGRTVAHNLGSEPAVIIVKSTSAAGDWAVYHRSLGATKYILLNSTAAAVTDSSYWQNTTPTSTEFTLGGAGRVNYGGRSYVAYLFAHDAGGFGADGTENVISCGSFTTNGSTVATVALGYEPQWIMAKRVDSSTEGDWLISDVNRGWPVYGSRERFLAANLSTQEGQNSGAGVYSNSDSWEPNSTGFRVYGYPFNASATYIYIAIRRGPMKVPESGTEVFEPDLSPNSNNPRFISGFPVDMAMERSRISTGVGGMDLTSRLTTGRYMRTGSANAEATSSTLRMDYMNGFDNDGDTSPNWVAHMFRRAPGFFDVVCYTGDGTTSRDVSHSLTVVPELFIIKNRGLATNWNVYTEPTGASYKLELNSNIAKTGLGIYWGGVAPAATTFHLGSSNGNVNGSGYTYVAYLFASCPGVSKVGSYTGTGTTLQINCGFTSGARFVLIKRTDSTGDWYVWDSARGIVAGSDPYLTLNTTAAEVTTTDWVDTYSAGFELSNSAGNNVNINGASYIFLSVS